MTKTSAIKSKYNSTAVSVLVGTVLAVIMSLSGAMIGSMLLNGGKISESAVYLITIMTWMIASFFGALATMKITGERKMLAIILTNVCYMAILMGAGILFFETNLKGVIPVFLSIVAGNIPIVFVFINQKSGRARKYRYKSK